MPRAMSLPGLSEMAILKSRNAKLVQSMRKMQVNRSPKVEPQRVHDQRFFSPLSQELSSTDLITTNGRTDPSAFRLLLLLPVHLPQSWNAGRFDGHELSRIDAGPSRHGKSNVLSNRQDYEGTRQPRGPHARRIPTGQVVERWCTVQGASQKK